MDEGDLDPKDRTKINESKLLEYLPGDSFSFVKDVSNNLININQGNDGIPIFMACTREKGDPITGLSLINFSKKEENRFGDSVHVISVTPQGTIADLNFKSSKGDEIYFVYKGGSGSPFGYNKRKRFIRSL